LAAPLETLGRAAAELQIKKRTHIGILQKSHKGDICYAYYYFKFTMSNGGNQHVTGYAIPMLVLMCLVINGRYGFAI